MRLSALTAVNARKSALIMPSWFFQKMYSSSRISATAAAPAAISARKKLSPKKERKLASLNPGTRMGLTFVQGRLNVGEAMPTPVIRKVKERVNHEGISIIDVSPGTSCPVVASIKGSDFCLLVTEPTPFGLNDLILAVETVKKLEVPCGVVINRAGAGNSEVEEYCLKRKSAGPADYSVGYRNCPSLLQRGNSGRRDTAVESEIHRAL